MLGFFGARPGHPLADEEEARRVFDSFTALPPCQALEEAVGWLESVLVSDDLRLDERYRLISRIDEAAQPATRRCTREYLTSPRLSRFEEQRLWQGNHAYWARVAEGYQRCLERFEEGERGWEDARSRLPWLAARLMRACGAELKWAQLRYGPVAGHVWRRTGRAYLLAEREGVVQRLITLYPDLPGQTSVQQEYVKALVFQASSMDSLLPVEIEIAERLIVHFLPDFVFTAEVRPDNVYWIDCQPGTPPTRLARLPQPTGTLRFLSTGDAVPPVEALCAAIEKDGVPRDLDLGGQYPPKIVLGVLRHLALYWAPRPPMRSFARHRVKSRLSVVHGLGSIHHCFTRNGRADSEAWIVEDVSQGGMGAQLPLDKDDWVKIGSLLGLQPEGGDNWLVGVVRRFHRDSPVQASVGIETLSKAPRAVSAQLNGMACDAILLDAPDAETVRVLLPARAYESSIPLKCELDGRPLRLDPVGLVETGMEFDIGRYRVAP